MKIILIILFVAHISSVTVNSQTWNIGSPTASAVTATLSDSTLTISGTGAMMNFTDSTSVPWYSSKESITNITIKDSITRIGNFAFSGCSSLLSVTIPESVTWIGSSAFNSCKKLATITLPDSLTSIGMSAFFDCSSLTSVSIPDNVTSISNHVFFGCRSLISVAIPGSVTSIGDNAFSACIGLTNVNIPNGVKSIGHYAFNGCSSLTTVNISGSITSIGQIAFGGLSSLTAINVDASNTAFSSVDGILYNKDTTTLIQCPGAFTSVSIPNSVRIIGMDAFYQCSSLESVIIPDSVRIIWGSAFYRCSSLISVTIPEGVTNIWNMTFRFCSSLTSIAIPSSVTSIGQRAFSDCSKLTAITIPDSVIDIGDYAFSNCIGLTSVTIPEGVTSIDWHAFSGCTSLTAVNFNAINCKAMGSKDYPVFSGCSSLNTINIGNGVTTLPAYAFRYCCGLTSITIPESVTSIGGYAFSDCSSLSKIDNQRKMPQPITTSVFEGVNKQTCVLIVPVGSVSAYKSSTGWKDFLKIFDDATAPSAPGGLSAVNTSSTSIVLTWTASSDNVGVTKYNIYLDGTLQGTSAGTNFTFTDLTPATSYLIEVEAVDSAGNISSKVSLSKTTSGIAISSVGENTIEIYPNPANDYVYVKNIGNKSMNIQISDMSGQMLIEQNLTGEQLDIQSLLPGIYMLKVDGVVFKLIKQ